jgi:site-specific DNA-methyltransferase (adenine-specific)
MPAAHGSRASSRSQPAEQHTAQPIAVSVERGAQAGGSRCEACGGLIGWSGWGTALKPAWEPIILARKPLAGTVAANVQQHGTGALNVDACRIDTNEDLNGGAYTGAKRQRDEYSSTDSVQCAVPMSRLNRGIGEYEQPSGRWPANLVLDEEAAAMLDAQSGERPGAVSFSRPASFANTSIGSFGPAPLQPGYADTGGASRFFYTSKASTAERNAGLDGLSASWLATMGDGIGAREHNAIAAPRVANVHPTVKPLDLMQWLCRLVTPPGGLILDPFLGSGSTMVAALREGFRCVGFEREAEYVAIARRRVEEDAPLFQRQVPA